MRFLSLILFETFYNDDVILFENVFLYQWEKTNIVDRN